MKKRKLAIAAGAASALAAMFLLVGCSSGSDSGSKKSSDTQFEVATVRWSDWGTAYTKFPNKLAKEAGISIKWDTYLNADWADKKATIIAGGELPDAFMGAITFTDQELAQNQSVLIPLEDYIDKDMPNLKKAMKENPALKAMITSPDGHIWSLPKEAPMRPIVANQLFINKTWLDKVGDKMPTTYDEFVKVLNDFKTKDPNGNGKADEIPYGTGNFDPTMSYITPFGVLRGADNSNEMALQNDKPVYLRAEDNFKEGVQAMHDAYAKGLIEPELYTLDPTQAQAKLMADTEIIGVSVGWTADATFGTNAKDYAALPALKGPDGNQYVMSDPDHFNQGRNEFMVTNKAKNVDALMKWVDKFYTNDASIQNAYGMFGVGTKKTADGYEVLKPKGKNSADTQAWIDSLRDFGPKSWTVDNSKVTFEDPTNGDEQKLQMDAELKQFAKPAFPSVTYTTDELTQIATIYPDLSTYATQQTATWVTKGGLTDNSWNDYIKKLNDMGLDKYLKIQSDAYNRYKDSLNQ
ncbi:ABC transporter substrate-binding protein [Lactovum odontotermitis]